MQKQKSQISISLKPEDFDNIDATKSTKSIFTNSEGWNVRPAMVKERLAPKLVLPSTSVMASRIMPTIAYTYLALITASFFLKNTGIKKKRTLPAITIPNCFIALCGASLSIITNPKASINVMLLVMTSDDSG